jgi:hypothetical protein
MKVRSSLSLKRLEDPELPSAATLDEGSITRPHPISSGQNTGFSKGNHAIFKLFGRSAGRVDSDALPMVLYAQGAAARLSLEFGAWAEW